MSALKAKEKLKFWTMTLTTKSLSKYGFFIVNRNQKPQGIPVKRTPAIIIRHIKIGMVLYYNVI